MLALAVEKGAISARAIGGLAGLVIDGQKVLFILVALAGNRRYHVRFTPRLVSSGFLPLFISKVCLILSQLAIIFR